MVTSTAAAGSDWRAPALPAASRVHEILAAMDEILARRSHPASAFRGLDECRKLLFECLAAHLNLTVARALSLKAVNLVLARYHQRLRHSHILSRPFGLVLDASNFCNLACPGCVHSTRVQELQIFQWENGQLPHSRLASLLGNFGPYAIQTLFSNYGEPLMNPETPKLVGLAKRFLMRVMLSSNMSVGRFDAESLVHSGLDYLVASIDGATRPVYAKYRRNGNLETVFRNLRQLVEAKRKLGRRTPVIAWHFLAFEHNVHEIGQALEVARQLGVNHFAALTPFDVAWDDPTIRVANVAPFTVEIDPDNEAAISGNLTAPAGGLDHAAIEREFEVGWPERISHVATLPDSGAGKSPMTCHWLYKSMSMDAGGRVFPCCGAPSPQRNLIFAQFDADPAADIYNSAQYRRARAWFADSAAPRPAGPDPHCVSCDWQKSTPNTDAPEIREFFAAAAGHLFNAASIRLLSSLQ